MHVEAQVDAAGTCGRGGSRRRLRAARRRRGRLHLEPAQRGRRPGAGAQRLRANHVVLATAPLPAKLAAAAVSVEDEHFYSSTFINVASGIGRAAIAAMHGSGDPGGKHDPQQLAKELYPSGSGFASEVRDLGLGIRISTTFTRARDSGCISTPATTATASGATLQRHGGTSA